MKPENMIRILIADDHYIVRMGIVALVNTEPDMEVVAEAADGAQAVELFEKHKPDLVLMDSRVDAHSF
jgi:YesN/AraC family two-component response regulator